MRRIVVTSLVVACLAIGSPAVSGAQRGAAINLRSFMAGLACTESGGRYHAVNVGSGAIGKYQIMPRNWRAWGRRYMGNPWASTKPRHQEFIARERISDLYAKHGDWRLVAHWWLTGNAPLNEAKWSTGATHYVNTVMAIAAMAAGRDAARLVPARCFPVRYPDPRIRDWPLSKVWITGGRVNVRVAPGYEHRSIEVVRQGMRFAVISKGEDARGKNWLRIGLKDGRSGWIAAWFTRPAN